MFKLTVIGKYGPYPKEGGATSSYLLTIGEKNILIDMGTGSLSNLQKIMEIKDIDLVLLSHLHSDHMADALVMRYALMALGSDAVDIYLPETPERENWLLLKAAQYNAETLNENTKFDMCGAVFSFMKTIHPVETYAVKVEYENKTFVYSADTVYDENLIEFASGCDVFLCDSAFLENGRVESAPHPSAFQAANMAKEAKVDRLLLTHINPMVNEKEILKEAKDVFDTSIVVQEMVSYYI